MLRNSVINFVLKAGLGIACLGFAVYSFAYPNTVLEFYPLFIADLIGDLATLIIGAAVATFMALWLLSRRHKFACSSTFLILVTIAMLANITSLRFLSVAWPLFVISLALSIRYYPRVRIIVSHKDGERMRIVPIEPSTEGSRDASAEDEVVDEDSEAANAKEDLLPIAKTDAHESAAPIPTMDEAPAQLENDPAQTSEFLNNEKFVRGNKFFADERPVSDEAGMSANAMPELPEISTPAIEISEMPPTPKPKRAYRPRAGKAKASRVAELPKTAASPVRSRSSRRSAHVELHEEF